MVVVVVAEASELIALVKVNAIIRVKTILKVFFMESLLSYLTIPLIRNNVNSYSF